MVDSSDDPVKIILLYHSTSNTMFSLNPAKERGDDLGNPRILIPSASTTCLLKPGDAASASSFNAVTFQQQQQSIPLPEPLSSCH
jgi:hypothetical protein